jgi:hypothetical protein
VNKLTFPLDSIRTDGWFERIGEGIGSFQALCEIVGDRFFAFSIIVGARITALTVDRRSPNQTQVDFVIGGGEEGTDGEPQKLSLADFRKRLVGALIGDEGSDHPAPTSEFDTEGTQLFIGVRYLLLAPLYGYSLSHLSIVDGKGTIEAYRDGELLTFDLALFRKRMRAHVHDELDRVSQSNRSAIDLARVAEAETHASAQDWAKVVQLLGSWPAPLAISTHSGRANAQCRSPHADRQGARLAWHGLHGTERNRSSGGGLPDRDSIRSGWPSRSGYLSQNGRGHVARVSPW